MSANTFERHANVVADVHDDVKHAPRSPPPPRSSPAVAVCSPTPKLRPDTVNDAYPLKGAFRSDCEATAASKVTETLPVPDVDATVTVAALKMSPNGFDRHASVVDDVHDDVIHAPRSPPPPRSSPAVAVCSPTPKLSPETVNEAYPLCGVLRSTPDTTAISKLNTARPVPGIAATVSCAYPFTSERPTVLHIRLVPEVHNDVEQLATFPAPPISSPAVAVCSPTPKLSPDTVTGA